MGHDHLDAPAVKIGKARIHRRLDHRTDEPDDEAPGSEHPEAARGKREQDRKRHRNQLPVNRHQIKAPVGAFIYAHQPHPVENPEQQAVDGDDPVEPLPDEFQRIDFEFNRLIMSMLEKDENKRPSATEALQDPALE